MFSPNSLFASVKRPGWVSTFADSTTRNSYNSSFYLFPYIITKGFQQNYLFLCMVCIRCDNEDPSICCPFSSISKTSTSPFLHIRTIINGETRNTERKNDIMQQWLPRLYFLSY